MLRQDTALGNLIYLRDVVVPWMKEHPNQVDFNVFVRRDCKCLLGWYAYFRYGTTVSELDKLLKSLWEYQEFGESLSAFHKDRLYGLFGGADRGTLDDRLALLNQLIEEKTKV